MKIRPVDVPGYLIPFIRTEMQGISEVSGDEAFTRIQIEPRSAFGMFLSTRVKKVEYKKKSFEMLIFSKKLGEQTAFSIEIEEYLNTSEFKLDLSFSELEDFYKFLDFSFRSSLYFFVKGYCAGSTSKQKLKDAISLVCERYNLLEYGYNENQLRRLFGIYKDRGGISVLQSNNGLSKLFFC